MIYRANNNPLVLTEDAADAFLESVGVKLFEDTISIDGVMYEGSYGESILEANGIFLYEDGIVLEGEAAKKVTLKDYKERKRREREEAEKQDSIRNTYKPTAGFPGGSKKSLNHYSKHKSDMNDIYNAANHIMDKDFDKRDNEATKHADDAYRYRTKAINFKQKTPNRNMNTHNKNVMKKRYSDTAKKYQKMADDSQSKFDAVMKGMDRINNNSNSVANSVQRHVAKKNKKATVQHNSTIFSDIEII